MTAGVGEMSMEEMRARGEAAALGQMQIMQAAIEALIAVAPKPDYIQLRLMQCLAAIQNEIPENPALSWVPDAVSAGASPVVERFLAACQANMAAQR